MNKPEVRIIQAQSEEVNPTEVNNSEAEYLLYKYGFKKEINQPTTIIPPNPSANLTFDQMVEMQNQREKQELIKRQQYQQQKKVNDGLYRDTKWRNMDIDGADSFGIKIEIVSDMKIPK